MITAQARTLYKDIVEDLLKFYTAEGQYLDDNKLFVEVCLRFGPRLLTTVCQMVDPPMQEGECAVGAIEVMREASARTVKGAP